MPGRNPLLGAALATAAGIAVLAGLGVWQLQRLEWKTALLDRIAANMAAKPVDLPADINLAPGKNEDWEYRRVCAEGTFRHDRELYLFNTNLAGEGGFHVITPLQRAEGTTILINRGWVPPARKGPSTRASGLPEGMARVCGIFRADEAQGAFTPANDPARNIWYFRDSKVMAGALGLSTAYPAFIDADAAPNEGGYPVGGQTRIDIPNNHLGYAITWFGLALALAGVFSVFARQRRAMARKSS